MLVSEMIEIVSTRTTREDALKTAVEFANKHPEFNFVMNLNAGKIVFHGMQRNIDFQLKAFDATEFGKNLGWFFKTKSAFDFLRTESTSPSFNVNKKYDVLRRMANSIPYKEWIAFRTAMRGELIIPNIEMNGNVIPGIETERFRGILSIMRKEEAAAEAVKINPVVTDTLIPKDTKVKDNSLIAKETEAVQEAPKKRGRPPKKKD